MKKNMLQAAVFPVLWLLYCAAVLLKNPAGRTATAAISILAGAAFMALVGGVLLWVTRGKKPSLKALAIALVALTAADQAAKAAVFFTLQGTAGLPLLGNWLSLQFAPNHQNNVLFNLLGINLPARWMDVAFKLVCLLLVAALVVGLYRRQPFASLPGRATVGITLVLAGSLSSVIDTAIHGFVLDFIVLSPIVAFDLKDLYLQFGIVLFVFALLEDDVFKKAPAKEA